MKQKRPRAFTNEPQQAGRQGLDSWAAGGEYLLQFPISRKPAFFSTRLFHTPWQLGCPMLH